MKVGLVSIPYPGVRVEPLGLVCCYGCYLYLILELDENLWDWLDSRFGIYNKYLNLFMELEENLWDWFEGWISIYTLSISGTGLKQGLVSIPYYPGAR